LTGAPEIEMPIHGSCHCGFAKWQFEGVPESATACSCTVCRRYGALWAYGYEGEGVTVSGPTRAYLRGDEIEFHFCVSCGGVAYWRGHILNQDGRRRIAVNLRLSEPDAIAHVPIRRFDGLDTFEDLPRNGRTVADYWY
jgi:hypothetical protein